MTDMVFRLNSSQIRFLTLPRQPRLSRTAAGPGPYGSSPARRMINAPAAWNGLGIRRVVRVVLPAVMMRHILLTY